MRKFIVSHLLLLMFLIGAASGFFLSNVAWWGLRLGEHDLDRVYRAATAPERPDGAIAAALRLNDDVLQDVLRSGQVSPAEVRALARIDALVQARFTQPLDDPAQQALLAGLATHYSALTASRDALIALLASHPEDTFRHYAIEVLPRLRQMRHALEPRLAHSGDATERAYREARAHSRTVQAVLLTLAVLASAVFCAAAWLTWRQASAARRQEALLEREHAVFKTLFHGSSDAIILLHGGRIVDCNHAALHLFGSPGLQQFCDVALTELQPDQQPDGSDSEPALRALLEQNVAAAGTPCFEWNFRSLDGKQFVAEASINAAWRGSDSVLQLVVRDISARKQAERSMRLANQAFENSLEGIAITDAKRNILTVNRAFSTITGYSAEEVIGCNPRVLSSGRQSAEFYTAMWTELNTHQEWQGELWNIRKNGDLYPQWLNITQVRDEHGEVSNYVGVFSDISELKAAHARTLRAVYYDQLTSLPNRVLLTDRLHQLFAQAGAAPEHQIALLLMDLDRLKVVNDSMGREAGDLLLQMVAARLGQGMHEADTLARMNGDEFAILLSKIANADEAGAHAQAILQRFEEPFPLHGELIHVSLSIGISIYPTDGLDSDALLQNAAMAMQRAKQAGGISYELYDQQLGAQASRRMAIETGLRRAVERGEFELHYQPQFDCANGALLGFEALLRWRHPELGLVAPDAFLAVAEETGLIVPIGAWVLNTACAQAAAWRRIDGVPRLMAVNLSARQLQHPDLVQHVTQALEASGLPANCLELEITESMMMHRIETCIALMHRLSALGVEFSIDDFGTGHSSLAYLKKMPIKALKIDQSFIRDIVSDPDGASIVGAIMAMSATLGLRVVAEGIEDQAQLNHLRRYPGIIGQGYLLGRPAPAQVHTSRLAALEKSRAAKAELIELMPS
jgi:diguanylate cyclase (GGDEF)-like protein/PAS domain S-box-containing protein